MKQNNFTNQWTMVQIEFCAFVLCVLHLGVNNKNTVEAMEPNGFSYLISFISGDMPEASPKPSNHDSEGPIAAVRGSNSTLRLNFVDFITNYDEHTCTACAKNNLCYKKSNVDPSTNNLLQVKCQRSFNDSKTIVIQSIQEMTSLLKPSGNSTKRNVEGNCVLVLFYTKSCPGSAMAAPHFNTIGRQFPDLKVIAVDVFKFYNLNTEYGIVGLPTLMLFHQGRPVVKFNETVPSVNNYIKFVAKHTGIKPKSLNVYVTSDDFLGPLSSQMEVETDEFLYISWAFIFICAMYYFVRSKICFEILESVKRNWKESEARHGVLTK